MNLPNKLTMLRILLVPVFILFVLWEVPYHYYIAVAIFAAASFTDYLDGNIARSRGLVTDFGKFADPLADKLLTTTAIVYLLPLGLCDPLVLVIILAREFAVAGVRMVAAGAPGGKVIAANIWGKAKTVLQMIAILVIYTMLGTGEFFTGANNAQLMQYTVVVSHLLMWLVAAATLISGVQYLWQNRSFINTAK